MDRRKFLGLFGCGGCAVAMGQTGCTIAEVFDQGSGSLTFNVAEQQFATLATVGGVTKADVAGRPLLLIRVNEASVVALNRLCTHVQCDMDPNKDGRWDGEKLICVCHDSHFDATGKVLRGPATRDLTTYPTTFDPISGVGEVVVGGSASEPEFEDPTPEEFRELSNPYAVDDAEALSGGEQLWTQCSGCHGVNGEGSDGFPEPKPTVFSGDNGAYSDGYLFWRLRTGSSSGPMGSIMPAYDASTLPDDDVWKVITYLRSLGR